MGVGCATDRTQIVRGGNLKITKASNLRETVRNRPDLDMLGIDVQKIA